MASSPLSGETQVQEVVQTVTTLHVSCPLCRTQAQLTHGFLSPRNTLNSLIGYTAKCYFHRYSHKSKSLKLYISPFVCRYKGASGSSAVCAFSMAQVERAFSGRYREVNRETQQWYTYNHPVPEPRPGAVSTYLLPSAGEEEHTHMLMFGSMSCQLHDGFQMLHQARF